jgi:hypothetical protein
MAPLTFDSRRLAHVLIAERRRRGWSSREMARRAGVSQPYVIALERAARSGDGAVSGKVPTIAVLAGLAHALQWTPTRLLSQCLSCAQRHALLVYDSHCVDPVAAADSAIALTGAAPPDTWLATIESPVSAHRIDLRPAGQEPLDAPAPYDPASISTALSGEFAAHAGSVGVAGLVVTQQSAALERPAEASVVLEFEQRWPDVVADRAAAADICLSWNVCAYDRNHLVGATLATSAETLLATHDVVWYADRHGVFADADATEHILHLASKGTP